MLVTHIVVLFVDLNSSCIASSARPLLLLLLNSRTSYCLFTKHFTGRHKSAQALAKDQSNRSLPAIAFRNIDTISPASKKQTTHNPPWNAPSPLIDSACTLVILTMVCRSARLAESWAIWLWRCACIGLVSAQFVVPKKLILSLTVISWKTYQLSLSDAAGSSRETGRVRGWDSGGHFEIGRRLTQQFPIAK